MIWQDLLFMAGGWIFSIALIPTVRSKEKPPKRTSFVTASVLLSFCVAYATLGFWFAFASTLVTSIMWFIIFFQKYLKKGDYDLSQRFRLLTIMGNNMKATLKL